MITFDPVYKNYIWGGNKIPKLFDRKVPPGIYAESWEISDRDDGMSIANSDPYKGMSFRDILKEHGESILGEKTEKFPLLVKVIDAKENLSIQVHPDENFAKKFNSEQKTECWVILEADKGSYIYAGFKENIDIEKAKKALGTKDILQFLQKVPVKKGDLVYIPGRRIHAISEGVVALEVQQNSNTTYRIYDFERGRPLHLKEALEVVDFTDTAYPIIEPSILEEHQMLRIKNLNFSIEQIHIEEDMMWENMQWQILFVLDGESPTLKKGVSYLLPADMPPIHIEVTKPLTFLCIFIDWDTE